MTRATLTLDLPTLTATAGFAGRLAPLLRGGDVMLLCGPMGAGKTALARALIGALRDRAGLPPEDVPSPTFTLVQTYDTGPFETWHADLYRLSDPSEVTELGLDEAFRDALCLIEWPDRLGADAPTDALHVALQPLADETRRLALTGPDDTLRRLAPAFAKDSR
ncbi:tRNA (adenosine(37)-N6)-threonylcarbamoyltransferase complex ATPase subunit type 1 TsaE [Jannaschia rubra]|uniref:tRNA threonylcarbamoyladenosine biosynthesis protein TsaE n=1 Tax=Jannaschia rubra TaxID=282197 RepID=A0A0M6XNF5_9RHOB|nr:tRNA (adenosine(37)-N6)-threonylcarbamoyltransferase complex ATPase subunit type 1 TsaE [Jannaschia rubra]CTQ32458.1 ADP-binding protein [Jannaschia rubra]SFF82659.1 tRNA threonylcarbamoyladenosine biosynthesis protein TsaE [Jannaschia rubra]